MFHFIHSCVIVILLLLCIIFWFILFYFIMFIQLHPDVMGDYVMRLYDVPDLMYYGRWNGHILFHFIYFISFLFKYTLMLWVIMIEVI